jgi:hypothetical protein
MTASGASSLALPGSPISPSPGPHLGKYELQGEIGRGGMGVVYRGYDADLKRAVAIKVLAPALSADPAFVRRFGQEAVAAANLSHPNIVRIYDVGSAGPTEDFVFHFIVMELLEGAPLWKRIEKGGPLSLWQANKIMEQVASALDYAHGRGLVHCDIKPANIMVDRTGHATLMDFGLTKAHADLGSEAGSSGSSLGGAGTPEYMAPEQILGDQIDARTDVYACGALLFHLLTGRSPFERAETAAPAAAVAYAQVNEPPPSLWKYQPRLPASVDSVVVKALAKRPGQRYQTVGELSRAFAAAAGLSATLKAGAGIGTSAPRSPRARLSLKLAGLALAVLLLLAAAGATWKFAARHSAGATPSTVDAKANGVTPGLAGAGEMPGAAASEAAPAPEPTAVASPAPAVIPAPMQPAATSPIRATSTLMPAPAGATPGRPASEAPRRVATHTRVLDLAAPRLVAPAGDVTVNGVTTFEWEWDGPLEPGLAFEVRLWREGSSEHLGASQLVSPAGVRDAPRQRYERVIDTSQTPAVKQNGGGTFRWTVAVVRSDPYERIGPEAPPRRIYIPSRQSRSLGTGHVLAWAGGNEVGREQE